LSDGDLFYTIAYCTNGSRGLSAIDKFLALICNLLLLDDRSETCFVRRTAMQIAANLARALLPERHRRDVHTRDPHHYEGQLYRAAPGLLSLLQPVSEQTEQHQTTDLVTISHFKYS